jgi:methylmalonyl-CoA carboxyltransferase large subunit
MTTDADQITQLRAQVARLSATLDKLDAYVQRTESRDAGTEVSDDDLMVICAAIAAFLGERATVRQVHLHRPGLWAVQGRTAIQESHNGLLATHARAGAPQPPATSR